MAKKRPSIKGQGLDAYLGDGPAVKRAREREEDRTMVTVYLPEWLVQKLDRVWLKRRAQDRKAQKSQIVAEALERYFEHEA